MPRERRALGVGSAWIAGSVNELRGFAAGVSCGGLLQGAAAGVCCRGQLQGAVAGVRGSRCGPAYVGCARSGKHTGVVDVGGPVDLVVDLAEVLAEVLAAVLAEDLLLDLMELVGLLGRWRSRGMANPAGAGEPVARNSATCAAGAAWARGTRTPLLSCLTLFGPRISRCWTCRWHSP